MTQTLLFTDSSLPQPAILSYVATLETPTRVRLITSAILRITGTLLLALCALAFIYALTDFIQFARTPLWMYPSVSGSSSSYLRTLPTSTKDMLLDHFLRNPFPLTGTMFAFLIGSMLLTSAGAVYRGRKAGCIVAALALAVLSLTAFSITLILCTAAFFSVSNASPSHPHLLWLIPSCLVAILLTLLLKDVISLLIWIFRNPVAEKPHVRFVG